MLCCRRSSSQVNNMLPFEHRLYLLDAIQQFVNERQFSEAKKKLKELKKIMEVDLTAKNGQPLQLPNLLQENVYVLERHGHMQIQRLEDALGENKVHQIKRHCSVLKKMFGIPTDDETLHQIHHENAFNLKTIKKTDRYSLKLFNCDLLTPENLKMCYRIFRNCNELKKVELQYCQIDDRTMAIFLKALARLPELMYLGLKGNNLTIESVNRLQEFLRNKDFKRLMWVDMSVNNAINVYPKPLVEALVERWPHWVRTNVPSKDVKLSPLDIIQGRIPRPLKYDK